MRKILTAAVLAAVSIFSDGVSPIVPVSAAQSWFASSHAGDVVFSNQSALEAVRAATDLVTVRTLIRQLTNVDAELPIRVFAVKGESALRQLLPQYWERRAVRPHAGSFSGPDHHYIALRTDVPAELRQALLLHEYVHLLSDERIKDAPAWLTEGLAEFWSAIVLENNAAVENKAIIIGRPPARHLQALRTQKWLSSDDLREHGSATLSNDPKRVAMFYAQSWLMVHYLLLGQSTDATAAFAPPVVTVDAALEEALRSYAVKRQFREIVVETSSRDLSAPTATPVSESRALAESADMLVFGERPAAALPLARRALSIDQSDPIALQALGTYYFLQNDSRRAREWLTRAFAADSRLYRSAIYLALLASLASDREQYLMTALRIKPDSTPAWERLWRVYEEDGRAKLLRGPFCDSARAWLLRQLWFNVPIRCAA